MTDLILHKNEHYISEDLDYYFSKYRDVNNQIRPSKSIYSLTPDSPHFDIDLEDGKIGSLFFPFAPFSLERIYIGISFPLFANNWGTSFLRYLLTRLKPDGYIILPVYPEMQAAEKNLWSRSILENLFLSRSRWKGTSNIWAENDGVMSMRLGRKWPAMTRSTAKHFFAQGANSVLRQSMKKNDHRKTIEQTFFSLGQTYWKNAGVSAIVEKIIQDYFGMKQAVSLCEIGSSHGLLSIECLLSDYINIKQAVSYIPEKSSLIDYQLLVNSFHQHIRDRFTSVVASPLQTIQHLSQYHVICVINSLVNLRSVKQSQALLKQAWDRLEIGGVLIVKEQQETLDTVIPLLESFGTMCCYSSIVASKVNEDEQISHYSSLIEQELIVENQTKQSVFRVIQKT